MISIRRFFAALTLAFSVSTQAQPTQTQYDSLLSRVQLLEKLVGVAGFLGPQISCPDLESHRPPSWFPNGEYDVAFRQKQLGCGINGAVDAASQALSRLPADGRSVQEYVNNAVSAIKPSLPPAPSYTVNSVPAASAPSTTGVLLLSSPPELTLRNTLEGKLFDIGIFLSRNDNGFRINRNWCFIGYESFCDPYQPQTGIAIEQDGVISFSGRQPLVNPVGRWDYPNTGKAFDIQPAGFCGSISFCEHFWIGSHSKGRGIEIGTNDDTDSNIDARNGKIWISGSGSADPISVYVGGAKRKLIVCPGTTDKLCVQ